MQLQFRIRSLMFVVVGIALVCTAIVELPESMYLLIPLVPIIGPSFSAGWTSRRYQAGRLDPISGALLGGIVQATLITVVWSLGPLEEPALDFLLPFFVLAAVHLVYGLVIGLIVTYGVLVLSSREPSSPPIIMGGRRGGTGLRDLEPALDADEMEAWSALFHEAGPYQRDLPSAAG